jgi:hypothetical protein
MTLTLEEFLRRFLQHVLPKGFPRIRYFGWLANRRRRALMPLCRTLLACVPPAVASATSETASLYEVGWLAHLLILVTDIGNHRDTPKQFPCQRDELWTPLRIVQKEEPAAIRRRAKPEPRTALIRHHVARKDLRSKRFPTVASAPEPSFLEELAAIDVGAGS